MDVRACTFLCTYVHLYVHVRMHVYDCVKFQASVGGFMKYLHMAEEDALALIGRSVALAKQARRCYLEKVSMYVRTYMYVRTCIVCN